MNSLMEIWHAALAALPVVGLGLLVLLITLVLSGPLSRILIWPIKFVSNSELIKVVLRRTLRVLVILLGLYIFLQLVGLTGFAVAILSGTGVVGLILGFAFRDIAENFISSLLLSVQRPFKIGDVIEVEGNLGVITQVTARATTLVDYDGNHIQIPNATIYKSVIKNFTANPNVRGKFTIGIGYDASIRSAQSLALKVLDEQASVLKDPEPQVLISELAAATVNLEVYFWVNSHTHSLPKVRAVLMRLIMRAFEQQGISMPDDKRERIFPGSLQVIATDKAPADADTQLPVLSKDSQPDEELDDISSDTQEIQQQATRARDPEQGSNIL